MRSFLGDAMDKIAMESLLPEEPPEGLVDWAVKTNRSEFGGEWCVFHNERFPVMPNIAEVIEHNSLASRRTEWGSLCSCSACGEDFITQKEPGMDAIRLVTGDDGWMYTVEIGTVVDPYMGIEVNREYDSFLCPICGSEVTLIHQKHLKGGRTKRLMVVSVQNVEGYTALIYWLVYRQIDELGLSNYGAEPCDAFVITETGSLVRYGHRKKQGYFGTSAAGLWWRLMSDNKDTIDCPYPDWGSINNRKKGAAIWEEYPELEGTTGEKTALVEYLEADGYRPVEYLKWWRKQRNVENLCRQGQAKIVADIVSTAHSYCYDIRKEAEKYLDMQKKKPHEMLRMSREEFRWLRSNQVSLTIKVAEQWNEYRNGIGKLLLGEFMKLITAFGEKGTNAALGIMRLYKDADLDKLARYMEKQKMKPSEVGTLLDTRNAIRKLYGRELTQEELWPKHLIETHDRIYRMLAEKNSREKADKLREGFREVLNKYGCLEWTDGELSVILPKDNGELVYEGDILRHCVGGYGQSHVSGNSVIFFIRRYRRPERPYYTLAINMKDRPRESQLHGYGNERHGKNKEYTHSIPKKVRAFCDRWENEILLPWYVQQQKQKETKTA